MHMHFKWAVHASNGKQLPADKNIYLECSEVLIIFIMYIIRIPVLVEAERHDSAVIERNIVLPNLRKI